MRLISFLGTGDYGETTYSFESRTCQTRYVAHALASFTQPNEIRLIATNEAWQRHGGVLSQELTGSGHPGPKHVLAPTGGESEQLWKMFDAIVNVIGDCECPVLLDITHGFRMQPFFAAACIQYVQSVLPNPPDIRVVYGEYRESEQPSPVWELTTFLDVLSWSRNLMMFLRIGRADEVVEPTNKLGRELSRQWAEAGRQHPRPQLETLAQAMKEFGDDLTTIRTGSILTGEKPSAQRLFDAIDSARNEVDQQLPALGRVLNQVQKMVEPLNTQGQRLASSQGQRTLLALARLYQDLGRYSEAISILREGWISLGAPAGADQPGSDYDKDARKCQEEAWQQSVNHSRSVSELRNGIQHAGFQVRLNNRSWFDRQLQTLLSHWENAIDSMPNQDPNR